MLNVDVVKDGWDYVAIAIGGLAALATVIAVWVAVLDSKQANERAQQADERTKRADARAEQAEAETARLRKQQTREKEDAHAAAWADRGAIHVKTIATLQLPVAGDFHADVCFVVHNEDAHPIQNVVLITEPPHALRPSGGGIEDHLVVKWHRIEGRSNEQIVRMMYVGVPDGNQGAIRVTTLFDDRFGNRWRLTPDRSLLLSGRRKLGVDDDPVDESMIPAVIP